MSRANHWPGPWTLRPRRDGSVNVYCASHDVALAVARCNAPLIAAAPDLLRALENCAAALHDIKAGHSKKPAADLVAEAYAAIALATDPHAGGL